jgi:hypothetical protein
MGAEERVPAQTGDALHWATRRTEWPKGPLVVDRGKGPNTSIALRGDVQAVSRAKIRKTTVTFLHRYRNTEGRAARCLSSWPAFAE